MNNCAPYLPASMLQLPVKNKVKVERKRMKHLFQKLALTVICSMSLFVQAIATPVVDEKSKIEQRLNDFHQAAAEANFEQYFGLLTEDAVFIGTDASERWSKESFAHFVKPYFSKGRGWLYKPTERHITVLANETVAYFDEALINESYGQTRGTGVLVKTVQGWKIAQYNLSIPMPNDLAKDLVSQIKQFQVKSSSRND